MLQILVADDERTIRRSLGDVLEAAGHGVTAVADGALACAMLRERPFDLVVSDVRMPRADGLEVFQTARLTEPATDVILMTGYGQVDDAVAAMKDGAVDYLVKPFDPHELEVRVQRVEERRRLNAELSHSRQQLRALGDVGIVGQSDAMRRVTRAIEAMADSSAPVLITGESGTGKELVARRLHELSGRRQGPFVAVNCAAFPETLIEAELFGHEKGAFTGAIASRPGRFVAASGGTLFLDEVAEIPMPVQAKLLRALQEGEVQRLGSNEPTHVDIRIITATHRNLEARIRQNAFREDLYYRIKVLDIPLPPLRERTGDLVLLTSHFLSQFSSEGREPPRLSDDAWHALVEHPFPGNVRELMHAIQRAVVLSRGQDTIEVRHLPAAMVAHAGSNGQDRSLKAVLRLAEREHIQRVLHECNGKKGHAANVLGVSRKTLWEKLRLYGLQ